MSHRFLLANGLDQQAIFLGKTIEFRMAECSERQICHQILSARMRFRIRLEMVLMFGAFDMTAVPDQQFFLVDFPSHASVN